MAGHRGGYSGTDSGEDGADTSTGEEDAEPEVERGRDDLTISSIDVVGSVASLEVAVTYGVGFKVSETQSVEDIFHNQI